MSAALRLQAANDHVSLPSAGSAELPAIITRHHVEDAIERLIAMLDDLDGDTDREPWFSGYPNGDREEDAGDDREIDADLVEGDGDADAEPDQEDDCSPETAGAGWNDLPYSIAAPTKSCTGSACTAA